MFWVSKGMEPRRGGIPLTKGVVKAVPAEPSGLASEGPCRPRVYYMAPPSIPEEFWGKSIFFRSGGEVCDREVPKAITSIAITH